MKFILWVDIYIGKNLVGRFGVKKDKTFAMEPSDPKWKDACDDLFDEITKRNEELSKLHSDKAKAPAHLLTNIQRWYSHSGRIGVSKIKQRDYLDE